MVNRYLLDLTLALRNVLSQQPIDLGSLDASLKRNSAYIKRLRTSLHAPDAVPFLLKEVKSLSLEKYTSELVSAAAEGLTKCKSGQEIYAAVDVCRPCGFRLHVTRGRLIGFRFYRLSVPFMKDSRFLSPCCW